MVEKFISYRYCYSYTNDNSNSTLFTLRYAPLRGSGAVCNFCLGTDNLKKCSKCQTVGYCSRKCQANDRDNHGIDYINKPLNLMKITYTHILCVYVNGYSKNRSKQ